MKQIPLKKRPPYFIYENYHPEAEEAFANWNHYSHSIPNLRSWMFDQIEYYAMKEMRVEKYKKELFHLIGTARSYDRTCLTLPPTETAITHMYVCELLVKVLLLFFGVEPASHHGYTLKNDGDDPYDFFCTTPKDSKTKKPIGVAHDLHRLFYGDELPKALPELREYFRLCPELRKECYEMLKVPPHVFPCVESYGCTGAHERQGKHYHFCNPKIDGCTLKGYRDLHSKLDDIFPDHTQYSVANGYTDHEVELNNKADNFISITSDIDGSRFALGFGMTEVPKQRDLEIRFYIIFSLGSMARYSPSSWGMMRENKPDLYLIINRFIESNHILFPFIVLRYMTGRAYSFYQRAKWG